MNKIFRHLVGKSTLKEGISIHKKYEDFFESPELGHKKEITLLFGRNMSVKVTLRRLDNIRGTVQIKYTNKNQRPLVEWLNDSFVKTKEGFIGEFLEFQKISSDVFRLYPIASDIAYNAKLYVADSMYHKADQDTLMKKECFNEIYHIINNIDFKADQGQSFYNQEIEKAFTLNEWHGEVKAIPELDLKCDYRKEIYQVEVEFGNARSYYQDYIKFMLSYFSQKIDAGVLVTPTINFANILCGIGKQKAMQKGRKTYSGMMH